MRSLRHTHLAALLLAAATLLRPASAQSPAIAALRPLAQADRIAPHANLAPQVQLSGHLPIWVRPETQTSARSVDPSATLRFTVLLRRDPAVQAAFEQTLAAQQDPASPLFHQWLTPAQIGQLYGPTPADLAAVTTWLAAEGLSVDSIAPNHILLEVSGPTRTVAATFHTAFAFYTLAGTPRLSASTEPSIPAALTPLIDSFHGLTSIPIEPHLHTSLAPVPQPTANSGAPAPQLTSGSGNHFITPGDFAVIYDLNSVYSTDTGATIGSKAQHVAIIGRARVNPSDISTFESKTGLPSIAANVILASSVDPGAPCTTSGTTCSNAGDQSEATLDVDRVIGTAYGAVPDLVISGTSGGYDGVYVSAAYNVNTLLDPVMTISFGACEANAGSNGVNLWNALFSTGAGEGISIFVSSGDSGVAGCQASFTPVSASASQVASINYICSNPYNTCVGGTEFNDTASPSTYWNSTNTSGLVSGIQYIPEGAWNEPYNTNYGGTGYAPAATGGGSSQYISKPSWQNGTGVPNDARRDVPDVALSASGHDGYYGCVAFAGADCTTYFEYFSGTSAAAPGMAGITALLNTKLATSQGNLNPLLYRLAASNPSAFHDATIATSGVSGCTSTPSLCNNSTPGPTGLSGGLAGYLLTAGYDQSTGLGSVDVANLLAAASGATFTITPASASLTLAAGATSGNTDALSVTSTGFAGNVTLTCAVSGTTGSASGTCSLQPASVSLTSGSTSSSTLTITTPAQTAGTFLVTITGTSGSLTVTSTVNVTVTGPSFTAVATPSSLTVISGATTGNTTSLLLTSRNGFSGTVNLTCTVTGSTITGTAPTCTPSPAAANLTSGGTFTLGYTVNSTIGTSGSATLSIVASGTSAGAPAAYTVTTLVPLTVNAPGFTITPAAAALGFTSGATTNNTDVLTFASTNGFNGTVTASCVISSTSAFYQPTCALSPLSVNLAAGGTATSTLTISSTTATTVSAASATLQHAGFDTLAVARPSAPNPLGRWRIRLAALLALALCLLPLRRRRALPGIAGILLAIGLISATGCSSKSTSNTATVTHSSSGSYVITVTATGTAAGSSIPFTTSATVNVTIN